MTGSDFDARTYWEERLAADYSLTGVGLRRLGPSFNAWAYRVRRERFVGAVKRIGMKTEGAQVVDIGSGSGVYVSTWEDLGSSVTGLDLTETAVEQLKKAFPNGTFLRADVSAKGLTEELGAESADAVSAMDVLFHVVDDDAFEQSLRNVHDVLRPGGFFLYSDLFVHGETRRIAHRVARPLVEIERALDKCGFDIVERTPLFILMNEPLDTNNPFYKAAWFAVGGVISLSDKIGAFAGRKLYPIEMKLTAKRTESPTTELLVARKR